MADERGLRIVKRLFKDYYGNRFSLPEWALSPVSAREFGVMYFSGVMQRHIGLRSLGEVVRLVRGRVPRNAYYSAACYERPDAEDMDLKMWRCADLSFDIDVDHIPTKCKYEHDHWRCKDCGYEGRGPAPQRCPVCGSERIERFTWICDRCLEEAKNQVLRLIDDFLLGDLGLSPSELVISFSGHRGYHVRVTSKAYSTLDPRARGMLIDYIMGLGVKELVMDEVRRRRRSYRGYSLAAYGWRGRVARGLYELISSSSREELGEMGVDEAGAEWLVRERQGVLRAMELDKPSWAFVRAIGLDNFERLLDAVVFMKSVVIDERVTKDVKRLMRLPNSLHGSTGLKATLLSYSDLEAFDPKEEESALGDGDLRVIVTDKRVFRITVSGYRFDPLQIPLNKPVKLPIPVAVYLALRGHAEIVGE